MKQLFFLIAVLLLSFDVSAQIQKTHHHRTTQNQTSTIVYARLGPSFNRFKVIDEVDNYTTNGRTLGFYAVGGFNKTYGSSYFYWGMELGLSTRGGKMQYKSGSEGGSNSSSSNSNKEVKYKEKALTVQPYELGFKYPITSDITVDIHIAPAFCAGFGGKFSGDYTGDSEPDGLDFRVNWGLGVWYQNFNLDLFFSNGLATTQFYGSGTFGNGGPDFRCKSLSLRLGVILFSNRK